MKVIAFEKLSFSDIQIRKTVCQRIDCDDKHYLLNRENLRLPIEMELSQKQKTFSDFFFAFLKSLLNFEYFSKKFEPHS